MAFLNKTMLQRLSDEATIERHPMLAKGDVPLNVREAYFQGCVLATLLDDGEISAEEQRALTVLGKSLQLTEKEITESLSIVRTLDSDVSKESFVREVFGLLAGETYPKFFMKDFERLMLIGGAMTDEKSEYLDFFGSSLCGRKDWRAACEIERLHTQVTGLAGVLSESIRSMFSSTSHSEGESASQTVTSANSGHQILADKCVGCGCCKDACPADAISEGMPYSIDPDKCVNCGSCAAQCPSDAIVMQ